MTDPGLRVEGGRQLRRTLKQAGVGLEELRTAHRAAAAVVASRGAGLAPRRTGLLAGTVRPAGTQTQAIVRAGYKRVPYAGPVHWGWPARNIAAQPFLSDAATQTEARWVGIYYRAVEHELGNVKGA